MTTLNYAILKNGTQVKTISAKGMKSIWTQFNKYGKSKNCEGVIDKKVEGSLKWVNSQDTYTVERIW